MVSPPPPSARHTPCTDLPSQQRAHLLPRHPVDLATLRHESRGHRRGLPMPSNLLILLWNLTRLGTYKPVRGSFWLGCFLLLWLGGSLFGEAGGADCVVPGTFLQPAKSWGKDSKRCQVRKPFCIFPAFGGGESFVFSSGRERCLWVPEEDFVNVSELWASCHDLPCKAKSFFHR